MVEEPGGLQSTGSQRVRQDLATEHIPKMGQSWSIQGKACSSVPASGVCLEEAFKHSC